MARQARRIIRILRRIGSGALVIGVGMAMVVVVPGTAQAARSCLLNSAGIPISRAGDMIRACGASISRAPRGTSWSATACHALGAVETQHELHVVLGDDRRQPVEGLGAGGIPAPQRPQRGSLVQPVRPAHRLLPRHLGQSRDLGGRAGRHEPRVPGALGPRRYYSEGQTYACEKSIIDSTTVAISSFNPFGNWTSPFLPMFFGETKNSASDLTGSVGAKTSFWDSGRRGTTTHSRP